MGKMFESKPAYQKGLIGEEIVKKYLESRELLVRRPDDTATSGASVVDFFVEQIVGAGDEEWTYSYYVEVKVKSPMSYAYGRFPVYTFPKSQIELYKRYAKEKDSPVEIFIVDEKRESIFVGSIEDYLGIEAPLRIEDKTFPVDVEQSNGIYRYYHIEQFYEESKIYFNDLERLRSIKFSDADKKFLKRLVNSAPDISTDKLLADSRAVVIKFLNLKLPDELPTKSKKFSTLVNSLRLKLNRIPTCYFYEIYHAVHNLNMAKEMPTFVSKFYPLLDEIKYERQKTSFQEPDVIKTESTATKIAELHAPNATLLEIFEVADTKPSFFVERWQLASACGDTTRCMFHWGIANAVKKVSRFYYLYGNSNYDRETLAVAVRDVSVILNEYIFNRVNEISKYEEAKEFLAWWEQAAEPYLEPLPEEKPSKNSLTAEEIQTIKELADSIQIKTRELNRGLASLAELLAKL